MKDDTREILNVITSTNPNLVAINIKDSYNSDSCRVLIWDAIINTEYMMYDLEGIYEILWDSAGDPYVLT